MERQTLWRANVVSATRTRDGRKQSHHRMGSSGSTSGRNVQRTYKQSFILQHPTSGLSHPSRPTSSLSQRTRPSLKADKLPARAHSSLGFAWSSQSVSKLELSQPQGFDLARYVKKQGSASEIRIGVNGEATNDDYFRSYLKECEKQLDNESTISLDDEGLEGDIFEGISISISQNTRKPQKHVPLCWEDQFQKAEPNIKTAGKAAGKTTAKKFSSPTYAKAPQSPISDSRGEAESWITQNLQDLTVMLSWGEMCVLDWTTVKQISTVTVPQTTRSEDVNQCEFEATVDPCTDTSTLPLQPAAADHVGCNNIISKKVQLDLLSSLLDKEKDINTCNSNLLCIWLKPSTGGTSLAADVMYKDLTFDVFVTLTGSSTVAFTKVKCRDISGGVLAIVVNLDGSFVQQDQFVRQLAPCTGQDVKISVTCHNPRRMLFSTRIMLPANIHTSSALPPIPSQPGSPSGDKVTAFSEKFFKRRSSYCNQEEDEDRTDIRVLASHYPDLQVLDLNNPSTTPLLLHQELTPSSHQTQRTGAHSTIWLSPPPTPTPSPSSTNRSLFRPHSEPHPTTGYVAIVKHWLRPYTTDSN